MNTRYRSSPSLALARRVNQTALAYTLSRMKVPERLPGNPVGIAYRGFGDATALWSVPEPARDNFKANVRGWLSEPDWQLYLARVDGRPAAAAILFLHDGVGYFADAATTPGLRGRGLHAALLSRRWQDATAAGVEFVCGGADYLSDSHRDMERSGLRLLFLRAAWTPLD